MANVVELSDQDFQSQVLQSDQPVLVDFWAPWCGPCRMIAPVIEELAQENATSAKFAKINIDNSPKIAAQFDVSSIPTLIIFKNGQEVDRIVGAAPKAAIAKKLDAVLAK